jgi:hypothetical protein
VLFHPVIVDRKPAEPLPFERAEAVHEGVEVHKVSYSVASFSDGRGLTTTWVQPAWAGGRHTSLAAGISTPFTSAWESSCARRSDDTEASCTETSVER